MASKTLDLIFSIGGGLLAVLLLVLGLVLQNQASFAKDYVHDQLSAQQITFTPEKGGQATRRGGQCLVKRAGKPLLGQAGRVLRQRVHRLPPQRGQRQQTYAQSSTASPP
ncbi:MAG: hypothetical protein R2746_12515 [Acidimicrobiales bacterium]